MFGIRRVLLWCLYGRASALFTAWEERMAVAGMPIEATLLRALDCVNRVELEAPGVLDSSKRFVAAERLRYFLRHHGGTPDGRLTDLAVRLAMERLYVDRVGRE